jgi:hypothetical protein
MAETTTPAGATPVVAGATPAQTPPADPVPAPATGADEGLGEGGRNALQQEREARRTAERELRKLTDKVAALELAGKSEQEQAVAKAKAEGATEALAKAQAMVRRASVREALVAAGCTDPAIVARADEFGALPVDEDGNVDGLSKAVSDFRGAHPTLFTARRPSGSADAGGITAAGAPQTTFTRAQIADPKFFEANKDAIMAASRRPGGITG